MKVLARSLAILSACWCVGCDASSPDDPELTWSSASAALSTCNSTVAAACPSNTTLSNGLCYGVPFCPHAANPIYRVDAYASSYDACVKPNTDCNHIGSYAGSCEWPICTVGDLELVAYGRDRCGPGVPPSSCPAGYVYRSDGRCVVTGPCCGNGTCEPANGETSASCYADCPVPVCGNQVCEVGEVSTCASDCPDTCTSLAACTNGVRALFPYSTDVGAVCGTHHACSGTTTTCVKAGQNYISACASQSELYQSCATSWYVAPWSAYAGCR